MNKSVIRGGVIIAVLVLTALAINQIFQRNLSGSEETGLTIKIGALTPLSGDLSALGNSIRNGMELARQELLEENPERKVDVIYEDVCKPEGAVSATQKLVNVDQVHVIGASFCLIGLEAVLPITEQNNVIVFNTAANTQGVLGADFAFSTNVSIKDDAQKIAEHGFKRIGAKNAVIVYLATPFGDDYNRFLRESFEQLGGRIIDSERVVLGKIDFRTEVAKLKSKNPDIVFVIDHDNSLGVFLRQARELGLSVPILGHYEAEDPTVLNAAGSAAEGFIISSSDPSVETEAVKSFREKYEAVFNTEANVLASNAYDALKLQVAAFEVCEGDTICMRDWLHNIKDYAGASGSITINQDGVASKPTIFKQVQNGKFVRIDS